MMNPVLPLAISISLTSTGAIPPQYELVHVSETAGTGVSVVGTDLNNAGQVCGIATSSFIDDMAFTPWLASIHSGTFVNLAPAAGTNDYLHAGPMSDSGRVAGFYLTSQPVNDNPEGAGGPILTNIGLPVPFGTTSHALFWSTNGSGSFTPVPGLGSILSLQEFGNIVLDMNSAGACVGISRDGSGDPFLGERAFLYDENNVLHDLSGVGGPGTFAFSATGIADDGSVCGVLRIDGADRAFVRDARGSVVILPLLFNSPEGVESMSPAAINTAGQVTGAATLTIVIKGEPFPTAVIAQRGFLWDPVTGITDLGERFPQDINARGDLTAMGWAITPHGLENHAFVRYADGTWLDLNDAAELPDCNGRTFFARAPAINDAGVVLAIEQYCDDSLFIKFRTHALVPKHDCIADIVANGQVDVDDLIAVILAWGACPASPASCPADIAPPGGNGQVNVDDLIAVILDWGACP